MAGCVSAAQYGVELKKLGDAIQEVFDGEFLAVVNPDSSDTYNIGYEARMRAYSYPLLRRVKWLRYSDLYELKSQIASKLVTKFAADEELPAEAIAEELKDVCAYLKGRYLGPDRKHELAQAFCLIFEDLSFDKVEEWLKGVQTQ